MRIQIYGSTHITRKVCEALEKEHVIVGFMPSKHSPFRVPMPYKEGIFLHDIKLSIQYDEKLEDIENAYNLHTGLLPEYGGCSILYHTLKNKEVYQGLTLHKMTEHFDFGEIISKITYPVRETDHIEDLYERIALIAPEFALAALKLITLGGKCYEPTLYKRSDVEPQESKENVERIFQRISTDCCKVIVTCFSEERQTRDSTSFPEHHQRYFGPDHALHMIKDAIAEETEGGMQFDTVIINNNVGFKKGNDWLDSMDGKETKNGRIRVFHRENKGGSFGGYNYAFENTNYDYYLFVEDDLIVSGEQYYKRIFDKFHSKKKIGFVALIGVDEERHHAHGGIGLTSREILNKVYRKNGCLPNSSRVWSKEDVIREGEMVFTREIFDLGYKLITYGTKKEWHPANLVIPYYTK